MAALQDGQRHQIIVRQAKQRRTQRPGQGQIMRWGHQHIQQRCDVLHLATVDQICFFADLRGNVQCLERLLQGQQTRAFA